MLRTDTFRFQQSYDTVWRGKLLLHMLDSGIPAVIALFADDVSILTTAYKKEDAKAAAPSVVTVIILI